jgi:hypothetical protein
LALAAGSCITETIHLRLEVVRQLKSCPRPYVEVPIWQCCHRSCGWNAAPTIQSLWGILTTIHIKYQHQQYLPHHHHLAVHKPNSRSHDSLKSSTSSALFRAHQTTHSASPSLSSEYRQHRLSTHHQVWQKREAYWKKQRQEEQVEAAKASTARLFGGLERSGSLRVRVCLRRGRFLCSGDKCR